MPKNQSNKLSLLGLNKDVLKHTLTFFTNKEIFAPQLSNKMLKQLCDEEIERRLLLLVKEQKGLFFYATESTQAKNIEYKIPEGSNALFRLFENIAAAHKYHRCVPLDNSGQPPKVRKVWIAKEKLPSNFHGHPAGNYYAQIPDADLLILTPKLKAMLTANYISMDTSNIPPALDTPSMTMQRR